MRTLLAGKAVPLGSHDGHFGSDIANIVGTAADPFFHDHSSGRDSLWVDWMADCGDGFDSSYSVARMLAQPNLSLSFAPGVVVKKNRVGSMRRGAVTGSDGAEEEKHRDRDDHGEDR